MSDFTYTGYCKVHHCSIAADDGGCPHCSDDKEAQWDEYEDREDDEAV